jgi:hypothetical protein
MWQEWMPVLHGSLLVAAMLLLVWGIIRPKKKPRHF